MIKQIANFMYQSLHQIIEKYKITTFSRIDNYLRDETTGCHQQSIYGIFNEQYVNDLNKKSHSFCNQIERAKADCISSIQLDDLYDEINQCIENIEHDKKRNQMIQQFTNINILMQPCLKQIFKVFYSFDKQLFCGEIYNECKLEIELEFVLEEVDEQEDYLKLIRQDINDDELFSTMDNFKNVEDDEFMMILEKNG